LAGPHYTKEGPGNNYTPGQDKLLQPGMMPESVAAQIMYAAAKGFAGVRAYGFDSSSTKYARENNPAGSDEQTMTDPSTVGPARWKAMSGAFNLIQTLQPYLLQPQANAPDLGNTIYTGAKDGPNGHLVMAINSLDMPQPIFIDLSPYLYAGTSSIQRYRLQGASPTTIPTSQTTDSLTIGPGEGVAWLIKP
jgi:hypothetical protein